MECPCCNADINSDQISKINNPNLVTCKGCGSTFYVEVEHHYYYADEVSNGVYECSYNEMWPN